LKIKEGHSASPSQTLVSHSQARRVAKAAAPSAAGLLHWRAVGRGDAIPLEPDDPGLVHIEAAIARTAMPRGLGHHTEPGRACGRASIGRRFRCSVWRFALVARLVNEDVPITEARSEHAIDEAGMIAILQSGARQCGEIKRIAVVIGCRIRIRSALDLPQ